MLSAPLASHRPLDSEEPLVMVASAFQASPQALTSWALNAAPSRICIYARAERLGRGGAGERARQLQEMGLVRLLPQRRYGDSGLFDYRVQRTMAPFSAAAAMPDPSGLTPDARLLLDLLTSIADEGERCPSAERLAALLGFKNRETVQLLLRDLHSRHLIEWRMTRVSFDDAEMVRVVTIVATGATSWSPRGGKQ